MRSPTILVVLCVVGVAAAVNPATWNHSSESDFAKGEFSATVVNSLGEVRLSRQVEVLMDSGSAPAMVSAVAVAGPTIYLAGGSDGAIYKLTRGKDVLPASKPQSGPAGAKAAAAAKFAQLPGAMVNCLLWTDKGLLAGVAGERAGIYLIDAKGAAKPFWSDGQVKYVWAILPGPKGVLYAATGPAGTVYEIQGDGKAQAIYKAGKLAKNILCLALSGDGMLYAGTDTNGLVVEIDPLTKVSRVLLDADEKEVHALVVDEAGVVYAGTSEASKAGPDGDSLTSPDSTGRAEKPAAGAPASRPASSRPASEPAAAKAAATPTVAKAAATPAAAVPAASPAPTPADAVRTTVVLRPPGAGGPMTALPDKQGNAVYRIGRDGLVRAIFRRPVTILSMLLQSGRLVLGTGNGGTVYSVSLDGDETAQLADTDARQITCLVPTGQGEILFATANKGSLAILGEGFAKEGSHTSSVLDAQQIAQWGSLRIRATAPARLTVATRSGNVAKPEGDAWSQWSNEVAVEDGYLAIASPAARYLQYRLKFTGAPGASPAVQQVQVVYQVGNLAPAVNAVKVSASARPMEPLPGPMPDAAAAASPAGPLIYRIVQIAAEDANKDKLTFKVEVREVGAENWIQLAEKLDRPQYVWDTRTFGDGTYEMRVTASDSPSNPPASALSAARVSEAVAVDNTPPVVKDLAAADKDGVIVVRGVAQDALSRLVAIHYAVDSQTDWVAVLPADGMCDASREEFTFQLKDLKSGAHRIAVKVEDLYGNAGYSWVQVAVVK